MHPYSSPPVQNGLIAVPLDLWLSAVISQQDFKKVAPHRWYAVKGKGSTFYAAATCQGKTIWMHRLVKDAPSGVLVDHKDGNGLNNRRSNLRFATQQQNAVNRGPSAANRTGYKGVVACGGQFQAQIQRHGVLRQLGVYDTAEEAACAYNAAAIRADGEFARANVVEALGEKAQAVARELGMTPFQEEIFVLTLTGQSTVHQVAARFHCSQKTVKKVLCSIAKRLEKAHRTEVKARNQADRDVLADRMSGEALVAWLTKAVLE